MTGVLAIGIIGVGALLLSGTGFASVAIAILAAAVGYQLLHNVNLGSAA
jgi:hypothetical protein